MCETYLHILILREKKVSENFQKFAQSELARLFHNDFFPKFRSQ
jgi:hypothetical protein